MDKIEAQEILSRLGFVGRSLGYKELLVSALFFDGLKKMLEIAPIDTESVSGKMLLDYLVVLNAMEDLGLFVSSGLSDT